MLEDETAAGNFASLMKEAKWATHRFNKSPKVMHGR